MTRREAPLLSRLEQARDEAAAARAAADRAAAPALEQLARLEAESARFAAEVEAKREAHEATVRERYKRQTFSPDPFRERFTEAVVDGDMAAAFRVYREMRAARNGRIAAGEVFGMGVNVGADEPKLDDWLRNALYSADGRDRDEAGAAIRAEMLQGADGSPLPRKAA
ncbi:MAG: hypothetical protein M3406_08200 [Chloroflexota bacterium]|nr:hypothetical protein [Chloroflexota bacterium]